MLDFERDICQIIILTVLSGGAGGLAAELLLTRSRSTGFLRVPAKSLNRSRLWQAGFLGTIFVGSIAALAFLVVYQPVEIVKDGKTTFKYPRLELLSMSIVVGAAGAAVLSALTTSVAKVAGEAKLNALSEGMKKVLKDLETAPAVTVDGNDSNPVDDAKAQLTSLVEIAESDSSE